ncbi:hypothetical protein SLT36_04650 [Aminobacter sp. BA135]|uniref:hypothetical protein n=1 Tax=Aminobacter sp. BA135 TaxID=537596 RepID=UPI003D7A9F43
MSSKVYRPADMNETFAAIRNSGDVEALLGLYEEDARLLVDAGGEGLAGKAGIAEELGRLVRMPGTMGRKTPSASSMATWRCCAPISRSSMRKAPSIPASLPRSCAGRPTARGSMSSTMPAPAATEPRLDQQFAVSARWRRRQRNHWPIL